jgi:hypothetical protein
MNPNTTNNTLSHKQEPKETKDKNSENTSQLTKLSESKLQEL